MAQDRTETTTAETETPAPSPKRRRTTRPVVSEPLLYPFKEGAAYSGLKYTTLRDVALRGEIPIVKVGSRWFVKPADLRRYIESRTEHLG